MHITWRVTDGRAEASSGAAYGGEADAPRGGIATAATTVAGGGAEASRGGIAASAEAAASGGAEAS